MKKNIEKELKKRFDVVYKKRIENAQVGDVYVYDISKINPYTFELVKAIEKDKNGLILSIVVFNKDFQKKEDFEWRISDGKWLKRKLYFVKGSEIDLIKMIS